MISAKMEKGIQTFRFGIRINRFVTLQEREEPAESNSTQLSIFKWDDLSVTWIYARLVISILLLEVCGVW